MYIYGIVFFSFYNKYANEFVSELDERIMRFNGRE